MNGLNLIVVNVTLPTPLSRYLTVIWHSTRPCRRAAWARKDLIIHTACAAARIISRLTAVKFRFSLCSGLPMETNLCSHHDHATHTLRRLRHCHLPRFRSLRMKVNVSHNVLNAKIRLLLFASAVLSEILIVPSEYAPFATHLWAGNNRFSVPTHRYLLLQFTTIRSQNQIMRHTNGFLHL